MRQKVKQIKILIKKFLGSHGVSLWNICSYKAKHLVMLYKVNRYNKRKDSIIRNIACKDNIKILFFVYNMGMWKYDGLIRLLMEDPRFEPIIIPFILDFKDSSHNISDQNEILNYCRKNNFPYRVGYDFNSMTYPNIDDINPDIVVYTQPYDAGYKQWRIDAFANRCLFVYTPYGPSVSGMKKLYDTYLMNIAWRIFAANQLDLDVLMNMRSCKSNNIVITGSPIYDYIKNAHIDYSPWKSKEKVKIIWAPHHSIDTDSLGTSNFETICFDMLELAKKYEDQVEFCFKPHPALIDCLIDNWGEQKAKEYYGLWQSMNNTFLWDGAYNELFAFSDGMIHDCCSFVCEYLFANKPVMFVCKDGEIPLGINTELGQACFEQHYHGYSISDIEIFVRSLLNKEDPMKNKRQSFVTKNLIPPRCCSAAENMIRELKSLV